MAKYQRRDVEIDVERVVRFLTYKFNELTSGLADNSRGSMLHNMQVEFAYVIHDIQHAPKYSAGKHITEANAILSEFEARINSDSAVAA